MNAEKNKIRELFHFDEVFVGTLEIFPEIYYHGEYIFKYCLYRDDAEVSKPEYPAVRYRPFSGRIKLEDGDRLVVFDPSGEREETEVTVVIDFINGFSIHGVEMSQFSEWFEPEKERRAKIYRKKIKS